ncbi:MAG: carbohydrate ABC transporter permease [Candidatus Eisenbacteria bacterium]|nr:carbohydrate ABC transporter permease [Candidatus Eisenbacteria bacterium]
MNRRLGTLLLHAILIAGAALTVIPLLWMVSASLMPAGSANTAPPPLLPPRVTFEHYAELFTKLDLSRSFMNSLIVSVVGTLLTLLTSSMAGYAFAKLRFPGREGLFRLLLTAMLVPAQVGMLPLFLMLKSMGLVNTYLGVLVPWLASVFGIFLVRQYALAIPDDLLDSARLDGASEWRVFRSVVLPNLAPVLATLAVFVFMSSWNDFLWPLVIMSDERHYTLPVALASLVGEHVQDTELMMAGAVVTVLPVLLVFIVLQRWYIRGVMAGSVKG